MIKKVTIKSISRDPKTDKNHKDYYMVRIVTEEEGELTGFDYNDFSEDWKPGDEQEVKVYTSEYQGKTYRNFKLPGRNDELEERIEDIEKAVKKLYNHIAAKQKDEEPDEIDSDNLPF